MGSAPCRFNLSFPEDAKLAEIEGRSTGFVLHPTLSPSRIDPPQDAAYTVVCSFHPHLQLRGQLRIHTGFPIKSNLTPSSLSVIFS